MPAVSNPKKLPRVEEVLNLFRELLAEDYPNWFESENEALGGRSPKEVAESGDAKALREVYDLIDSQNYV